MLKFKTLLGAVGLHIGPTGDPSIDGNISPQRRKKEGRTTFEMKVKLF